MSTATLPSPRFGRRDPFTVFLFFSLLLHLLLLLLFPSSLRLFAPAPEQLTEVELLPLPAPPPSEMAKAEPAPREEPNELAQPAAPLPEQIVNPPDRSDETPPRETRLLSDRDSSAKEQSVAVGVPRPQPPESAESRAEEKTVEQKPPVQMARKSTPPAPPQPEPSVEKQVEKALGEEKADKTPTLGSPEATRPPQLFARAEDLLAQGWLSDRGADQDKSREQRTPEGNELIAMAPPPAPSLFSLPGPSGTPDFLPDVQRGNLTLLNTKAHRFAPFVRRVALRVFQHLVILQRKSLQINDIVAAQDMVTIEAKLDDQGNLVGLALQTLSGSHSVDKSLLNACQQGAWDQNPPAEAKADDGLFHFIFRSHISPQYDDFGLRAIITVLQVGLV